MLACKAGATRPLEAVGDQLGRERDVTGGRRIALLQMIAEHAEHHMYIAVAGRLQDVEKISAEIWIVGHG